MDRYDEAVEYFKAHPEQIDNAWDFPLGHKYGYLFQHLCDINSLLGVVVYGCPVQVKMHLFPAQTQELTQYVRNSSIPENARDINVDNLHKFAEIQRYADKHLGRSTTILHY